MNRKLVMMGMSLGWGLLVASRGLPLGKAALISAVGGATIGMAFALTEKTDERN